MVYVIKLFDEISYKHHLKIKNGNEILLERIKK